jgi:23S rRNA pseudouridine1911/1915/1917 synthase
MRNPLVLLWSAGSLSGKIHRSTNRFLSINSKATTPSGHGDAASGRQWTFRIEHSFTIPSRDCHHQTLLEYLLDQQIFATSSQARRAIRRGEILVLAENETFDPYQIPNTESITHLMPISSRHSVHQVTRLPNLKCYPVEISKYIYPPKTLLDISSSSVPRHDWVVYENDEMAVVHKPENMTTIDGGNSTRDDLQSLLPFILAPPTARKEVVLPRPVHRLDRATSGLVIVAKTQSTLQRFSSMFASQSIHKTYTAVVFGKPQPFTSSAMESNGNNNTANSGIIDYPIDGKPAVTDWKVVETNGTFSRIELHPRTGRYHQLRRHLAYCLKAPIVGDAKYDLVGALGNNQVVQERLAFRERGLLLCCNQLEFDYPGGGQPVACESYSGPTKSYSITEDNQPGVAATKRMRVHLTQHDKMFQLFRPQT